MVRYFFILSRRDPDLYAYLKDRFSDDTAVEVIMDRRHAPPAASIAGSNTERRRHPDADDELMLRSYTVVTVPDAADGFSRLEASATT